MSRVKGNQKEKNLFLFFLIEKVFTEGNLILQEFFHLAYIFDYFSVETKEQPSTSMRDIYSKLKTLFHKDILPDLERFAKDILGLENMIEEIKELSREKNRKQEEISYFWRNFFVKYFEVLRTKEFLREHLDYLQKKTISLLEGFAGYYPRPKCFSVKEAIKIHFFIEKLIDNFKYFFYETIFNKKFLPPPSDIGNKNVSIYWDFLPSIRFISTNFERLITKTDFLTPQRQSYWIILLHEVIHHLLYSKGRILPDKFKEKKLKAFQDISRIIEESLKKAGIKMKFFEENLFTDLFVDWLLTKIFGILYVLPASLQLFSFDDESFLLPKSNRVWYIRLKTILSLYSPEKEPFIKIEKGKEINWGKWREWSKEFKTSALKMLERFKREQIKTGLANPYIYLKDEITISVVGRYLKSFFEKKVEDIIKDIQNKIIQPWKREYWLNLYTKYLYSYYYFNQVESVIKNDLVRHREGRALCKIFCDFLCFYKYEVSWEECREYFNLPVYHFMYVKLRYDIPGIQDFKELKKEEKNHAWGLGAYTYLSVSKNESHEKVDEIRKWEKQKKEYEEKKFKFYKEDWYLTLYDLSNQDKLRDVIKTPEKYLFVFIKYQLLKHLSNLFSCSIVEKFTEKEGWKEIKKEVFDTFTEKCQENFKFLISCFHFICFEWFDFCTLITIDLEKEKKFHLNDFLQFLKKELLINNQRFYRTDTDIFIGKEISKKVIIENPSLYLRLTSNKLKEGYSIAEKLFKKLPQETRISSHFGIKDLSIELKNEFTFEDLLKILQELISEREISDIQILPCVRLELEKNLSITSSS